MITDLNGMQHLFVGIRYRYKAFYVNMIYLYTPAWLKLGVRSFVYENKLSMMTFRYFVRDKQFKDQV